MCTVLDVVENRGRVAGLEEGMEKGMKKGLEKGMKKGMEKGLEKGLERGMKKGRREGKEEGGSLINYLWLNGRGGEAQLALKDQDLYDRLLEEYKAQIHGDDVVLVNEAVKA